MPLFKIPGFTITESQYIEIAQGQSPILWDKFYKVILKDNGQSELHMFDNLLSLVNHEQNDEIVYHFVDLQFENSLPLFLFIDVDKSKKRINFFRDFTNLPNGWLLYFNSKNKINFRNLNANTPQNLVYLKDNYPYKNVEFFVGVSSLVEVMKHTTSKSFEQILPTLEMKSKMLQEVKHFNHCTMT